MAINGNGSAIRVAATEVLDVKVRMGEDMGSRIGFHWYDKAALVVFVASSSVQVVLRHEVVMCTDCQCLAPLRHVASFLIEQVNVTPRPGERCESLL